MNQETMDEFTSRLAEEITQFWRSFRESEFRDQYKEKFRVAIHREIIQQLIVATGREMGNQMTLAERYGEITIK